MIDIKHVENFECKGRTLDYSMFLSLFLSSTKRVASLQTSLMCSIQGLFYKSTFLLQQLSYPPIFPQPTK